MTFHTRAATSPAPLPPLTSSLAPRRPRDARLPALRCSDLVHCCRLCLSSPLSTRGPESPFKQTTSHCSTDHVTLWHCNLQRLLTPLKANPTLYHCPPGPVSGVCSPHILSPHPTLRTTFQAQWLPLDSQARPSHPQSGPLFSPGPLPRRRFFQFLA